MPVPASPWQMVWCTGVCIAVPLPPAARFAQGPLSSLLGSFLSLRLVAETAVRKAEHQRSAQAAEGSVGITLFNWLEL